MQTLEFVRIVQEIKTRLQVEQLISFMDPLFTVGSGKKLNLGDRHHFAALLFESRVGFAELSKDEETRKILVSLGLEATYETPRLFKLIAHMNALGDATTVTGNGDIFNSFFSFYQSLSSLRAFADTSSTFLNKEGAVPLGSGEEILKLSILDYDGTGVEAERVQEVFASLVDVHTHLARVFQLTNSTLRIAYLDSGSDVSMGLVTAALIVGALKFLFKEIWEKVKYKDFAQFDRKLESLGKGLNFTATLEEHVSNGSLKQDEAAILKERVLLEMEKLITNGTTLPLAVTAQLEDQRKLLTDKRDTKLLGVGEPPVPPTE